MSFFLTLSIETRSFMEFDKTNSSRETSICSASGSRHDFRECFYIVFTSLKIKRFQTPRLACGLPRRSCSAALTRAILYCFFPRSNMRRKLPDPTKGGARPPSGTRASSTRLRRRTSSSSLRCSGTLSSVFHGNREITYFIRFRDAPQVCRNL